jgi:hypothetical protein
VSTGPPGSFGVLTNPGTSVLLGESGLDYGPLSGFRATAGLAVPCFGIGAAVSVFVLPSKDFQEEFIGEPSVAGGGVPVLARPVFDPTTGVPSAQVISFPGAFTGRFDVTSSTRLWGADVNMLLGLHHSPELSVDLLAGYRHLSLCEDLVLNQQSSLLAGGFTTFDGDLVFAPATLTLFDRFDTENRFDGAQVGAQAEFRWDSLFVYLVGKVALGTVRQDVGIEGGTVLRTPFAPQRTAEGGLFAQPSNIGQETQDDLAVVPEVGINVGWKITSYLQASLGYTFLYWGNVVRPGGQIDPATNPNLVVSSNIFAFSGGSDRPAPLFHKSDFWAQGLNLSFLFRY